MPVRPIPTRSQPLRRPTGLAPKLKTIADRAVKEIRSEVADLPPGRLPCVDIRYQVEGQALSRAELEAVHSEILRQLSSDKLKIEDDGVQVNQQLISMRIWPSSA